MNAAPPARPRLSIVATLYRSSPYVETFHARASAAARARVGEDFEVVLVNDGSPDDSVERARRLAEADPHVVVVDLSRNFGHHAAMLAGLEHAAGEQVFLIDSDLEESPEWLETFARELDAQRADVVFGVQGRRRGGAFERASGALFYRVFRAMTGVAQPDNIVTARLMTRRYVDALLSFPERELNIGGLWVSTGFVQRSCVVEKASTSPTTYTLARKLSHLVNAVTSFSSQPLVFTFYAGLAISATALMFILSLVFRYFFVSSPPDGYTSIVASIWLFSGLIIFFMGVQGIYVAKVFSEVKRRPRVIVREVFRAAAPPTAPGPDR